MNFFRCKTDQERRRMLHPLAIFILLVFLGVILFCSGLSFPESRYNFLGASKHVELTNGAPVTQVFTARSNNLEGVKINLKNDVLYPGETLRMGLYSDACEQEEIAHHIFSSFSGKASPSRTFSFSPIKNSEGGKYCLMITYSSPYPKRAERPEILASEGGSFAEMSYIDTAKGREYKNRSLQIRPLYGERSLAGRVNQLENRLSQYKPFFMKGRVLLLAGSVLLFSSAFFGLFTRQFIQRSKED